MTRRYLPGSRRRLIIQFPDDQAVADFVGMLADQGMIDRETIARQPLGPEVELQIGAEDTYILDRNAEHPLAVSYVRRPGTDFYTGHPLVGRSLRKAEGYSA